MQTRNSMWHSSDDLTLLDLLKFCDVWPHSSWRYNSLSMWSGRTVMSTSNLSCTCIHECRKYQIRGTPTSTRCEVVNKTVTSCIAACRSWVARHTWLRTLESSSEATKVIANPLVPKRPARPTCQARLHDCVRHKVKSKLVAQYGVSQACLVIALSSWIHERKGRKWCKHCCCLPCAGMCQHHCHASGLFRACRN